MSLANEIETIVEKGKFDPKVSAEYIARLTEGRLTRDENPTSHFCAYFAAFNPNTKQVFIGHHKKSGLWLFNGGHIDPNESVATTLTREMSEEWGIQFVPEGFPFIITITEIKSNPAGRPCKRHFDLWYKIPINIEPLFDKEKLETEFYECRWMNISEAVNLVTDPSTLQALRVLDTV